MQGLLLFCLLSIRWCTDALPLSPSAGEKSSKSDSRLRFLDDGSINKDNCEKDGRIYNNGEKIISPEKPCEVCFCQGGDILCTKIRCFWRDDCEPKYEDHKCCPSFDHCPPLTPGNKNVSFSMSTSISSTPDLSSSIADKESQSSHGHLATSSHITGQRPTQILFNNGEHVNNETLSSHQTSSHFKTQSSIHPSSDSNSEISVSMSTSSVQKHSTSHAESHASLTDNDNTVTKLSNETISSVASTDGQEIQTFEDENVDPSGVVLVAEDFIKNGGDTSQSVEQQLTTTISSEFIEEETGVAITTDKPETVGANATVQVSDKFSVHLQDGISIDGSNTDRENQEKTSNATEVIENNDDTNDAKHTGDINAGTSNNILHLDEDENNKANILDDKLKHPNLVREGPQDSQSDGKEHNDGIVSHLIGNIIEHKTLTAAQNPNTNERQGDLNADVIEHFFDNSHLKEGHTEDIQSDAKEGDANVVSHLIGNIIEHKTLTAAQNPNTNERQGDLNADVIEHFFDNSNLKEGHTEDLLDAKKQDNIVLSDVIGDVIEHKFLRDGQTEDVHFDAEETVSKDATKHTDIVPTSTKKHDEVLQSDEGEKKNSVSANVEEHTKIETNLVKETMKPSHLDDESEKETVHAIAKEQTRNDQTSSKKQTGGIEFEEGQKKIIIEIEGKEQDVSDRGKIEENKLDGKQQIEVGDANNDELLKDEHSKPNSIAQEIIDITHSLTNEAINNPDKKLNEDVKTLTQNNQHLEPNFDDFDSEENVSKKSMELHNDKGDQHQASESPKSESHKIVDGSEHLGDIKVHKEESNFNLDTYPSDETTIASHFNSPEKLDLDINNVHATTFTPDIIEGVTIAVEGVTIAEYLGDVAKKIENVLDHTDNQDLSLIDMHSESSLSDKNEILQRSNETAFVKSNGTMSSDFGEIETEELLGLDQLELQSNQQVATEVNPKDFMATSNSSSTGEISDSRNNDDNKASQTTAKQQNEKTFSKETVTDHEDIELLGVKKKSNVTRVDLSAKEEFKPDGNKMLPDDVTTIVPYIDSTTAVSKDNTKIHKEPSSVDSDSLTLAHTSPSLTQSTTSHNLIEQPEKHKVKHFNSGSERPILIEQADVKDTSSDKVQIVNTSITQNNELELHTTVSSIHVENINNVGIGGSGSLYISEIPPSGLEQTGFSPGQLETNSELELSQEVGSGLNSKEDMEMDGMSSEEFGSGYGSEIETEFGLIDNSAERYSPSTDSSQTPNDSIEVITVPTKSTSIISEFEEEVNEDRPNVGSSVIKSIPKDNIGNHKVEIVQLNVVKEDIVLKPSEEKDLSADKQDSEGNLSDSSNGNSGNQSTNEQSILHGHKNQESHEKSGERVFENKANLEDKNKTTALQNGSKPFLNQEDEIKGDREHTEHKKRLGHVEGGLSVFDGVISQITEFFYPTTTEIVELDVAEETDLEFTTKSFNDADPFLVKHIINATSENGDVNDNDLTTIQDGLIEKSSMASTSFEQVFLDPDIDLVHENVDDDLLVDDFVETEKGGANQELTQSHGKKIHQTNSQNLNTNSTKLPQANLNHASNSKYQGLLIDYNTDFTTIEFNDHDLTTIKNIIENDYATENYVETTTIHDEDLTTIPELTTQQYLLESIISNIEKQKNVTSKPTIIESHNTIGHSSLNGASEPGDSIEFNFDDTSSEETTTYLSTTSDNPVTDKSQLMKLLMNNGNPFSGAVFSADDTHFLQRSESIHMPERFQDENHISNTIIKTIGL